MKAPSFFGALFGAGLVHLVSCAAYQEHVAKIEEGLRLTNDLALVAEKCTADFIDQAIIACERKENPLAREACLEMVANTTEDVRKLIQDWRAFRCSLGGLEECRGEGGGQP